MTVRTQIPTVSACDPACGWCTQTKTTIRGGLPGPNMAPTSQTFLYPIFSTRKQCICDFVHCGYCSITTYATCYQSLTLASRFIVSPFGARKRTLWPKHYYFSLLSSAMNHQIRYFFHICRMLCENHVFYQIRLGDQIPLNIIGSATQHTCRTLKAVALRAVALSIVWNRST